MACYASPHLRLPRTLRCVALHTCTVEQLSHPPPPMAKALTGENAPRCRWRATSLGAVEGGEHPHTSQKQCENPEQRHERGDGKADSWIPNLKAGEIEEKGTVDWFHPAHGNLLHRRRRRR